MNSVAYIGFGANLGDKSLTFQDAVHALGNVPTTEVSRVSRLYETEPIGLSDNGPRFLNAVVELRTDLSPHGLMRALQNIERDLGKAQDHRSDQSRFVDLDLLLYGNECINRDGLIVPHARMHLRAFVLVPLSELAPDMVLPNRDRTVADMLREVPERELRGVRPVEGQG
jgi:2-amino-4-hydroxy-6-hydroxymethyldihydropteridine diphosphokinase